MPRQTAQEILLPIINLNVRNSEYVQEIPQSQTADKPVAPLDRATQQLRDTRRQTKQINLLSLPH